MEENLDEYYKRPNVRVTGILISEPSNRVFVAYEYGFKDQRIEGEVIACTYSFIVSSQGILHICYDNKRELWKALRKNFWATVADLPQDIKPKWEQRILNKIIDLTVDILYANGGRLEGLDNVVLE